MAKYINVYDINWLPPAAHKRNYHTFSLDDAYDDGYYAAMDQVLAVPAANVYKAEYIKQDVNTALEFLDELNQSGEIEYDAYSRLHDLISQICPETEDEDG